ncbi:MAG: MBL fold metallo-hydrolase [Pyrinomonadaceae bacterium]|nr:MBL fold metallo-hydrolase [Pyrinomonadaceae bacterium]
MRRKLRRMLVIAALLAASLTGGTCIYTMHPKFGKLPEGARLDKIKRSPNYSGDGFQNLIPTPVLAGDRSFVSVGIGYLFSKKDRPVPPTPIPSVKTDLQALDRNRDVFVWLGHSSYFIQLGGSRILFDPVFSGSAGPVPYLTKAFDGTNPYTADDLPEIDYLVITHDHWDHLDYATVTALRARTKTVVCGLGVGAHLERWGYDKEKIHEADWYSVLEAGDGFAIHLLPARHYSGRLLTRNKTLWVGYAITTTRRKIFVSGDSGYGPHFPEIGRRFGGFDLVALDTGQYDELWPHIHMTPEEAAQAALDLQADALLPGHVGKFSLARHSWDDPFRRITAASEGRSYRLLTPMIGLPILVDDQQQRFSRWWEDLAQSPETEQLGRQATRKARVY